MAEAIGRGELLGSSLSLVRSLRAVCTLRLAVGYTILLGAITAMLGTSWDIQWHSFVGRDRTLIPPHLMMLSGITLCGVAALAAVLIETAWARRNPQLARDQMSFAGLFSSSLGAYIAGFAALDAAIAFPLDSYWHALYGIDVRIWAPFHVMILVGGALIPLGAAYMLLSAVPLAGRRGARRAGYIGAIIALATMLSIFTILLSDATDDPGFLSFGDVTMNLFPLLSGVLVAWVLVAAVYAIPWRRVATSVSLVYLLFGLMFEAFVPAATNSLVGIEHLSYRRDLGSFAVLSIVAARFWPLLPIVAAMLIDYFYRRAGRNGWSQRRLGVTLAVTTLIACFPLVALEPTFPVLLVVYLGVVGFPLSMLLGFLGTSVGTWFGRRMGESMQQVGEVE